METAEPRVAPIPAPRDGADNSGGAAPGPGCRETPAPEGWSGDDARRLEVGRGGMVFVDFGKRKVYALTSSGDEVAVFNNLAEMVERLKPSTVVLDILPRRLENSITELARTGIIFLRLKNLRRISEERRNNGLSKTDENDVKILRQIFRQRPDEFQSLFTIPEELEVKALTELWVELAMMKKASRRARTITSHPIVININRSLRTHIDELSREVHEKALKLPLYKKAVEVLGLKGPALAYIISHDAFALITLPRDALLRRYHLLPPYYHRWDKRSRILVMLAGAAVLNRHPTYHDIYTRYMEKFWQKSRRHWKAVLRVARKLLIDLRRLSKENRKQTPNA